MTRVRQARRARHERRAPAFFSSDGAPILLSRLLEIPLLFATTGNGEFPFRATVHGRTLAIRVDDFPAEPLYSIIVDDENVGDLEDWPPAWRKPNLHLGGPDD